MAERVEEPEVEGASEAGMAAISPAATMAIGARRQRAGSKPDPQLDVFLERQTRLTELQTEHMQEQRELILSRLRWGRFSDRMKAVLQVMTALVGLGVVAGVSVMAWSASQDRSLVVEPFSAPPAFAQSGMGGQVIAADVVERMAAIHRVVGISFASSKDVVADAQDEVKLEIPETGVSVAELSRALRGWLGAQRTIEGSLRQTTDGQIKLVAHLAGNDPVSATGAPAQLEDLERQVAEQLFAQLDPTNFANYLAWAHRRTEALAFMARLPALATNDAERANVYALWSSNLNDPVHARALSLTALALDPKLATSWYEKFGREHQLGHDEASLAAARRLLTTRDRDQIPAIRGAGFRVARNLAIDQIDGLTGDFAGQLHQRALLTDYDRTPAKMAPIFAGWHDARAGRLLLAGAGDAGGVSPDLLSLRLYADLAADDWAAAARDGSQLLDLEEQGRATAAAADDQAGFLWAELTRDRPRLAEARARTGDLAGALAAIAPTPLDCYPCLRERGRVAAAEHDWAGAGRWFAEAARQGPSLPFAYADWGEMLLARGDLAGALDKLRLAHEKGPYFADPLEVWGETLIRVGDYRGAAATFALADEHAPKWGRNHLMWGEALMLSGRYREARAQYQLAWGLDLGQPDRAALKVLLERTASGPLHG